MLIKNAKKRFFSILAESVGVFILRFIYLTCKTKIHGELPPNRSCLLITWHREILMMPFCYNELSQKRRKVKVVVSEHGDGRLIGNAIKKISGAETINGSTSKYSLKVLLCALRDAKSGLCDIAISPDGPRGPIYSVAGGVVMISQKENIPIVTVNCKPSNFWQFKSWDKMFLPKPFSKIDFYVGKPFLVTDMSMTKAKNTVKERLSKYAFK